MLAMICVHCGGRWVALCTGGTHHAGRSSYHFETESLDCPRCERPGEVNGDLLLEYQRHPDTVATRFGP